MRYTRLKIIRDLFLVGIFIILGRLFYIQAWRCDDFRQMARAQHLVNIETSPIRGTIYDRNLHRLAISMALPSIYAYKVKNKDRAARILARLLPEDYTDIRSVLSVDKPFVWIKRKLDYEFAERLDKEMDSLKSEGIGLVWEAKRGYPLGELAKEVIGFVGVDNVGLEGIELYYNSYLKGRPGWRSVGRDARQRLLYYDERLPCHNGDDLILTIDEVIQHICAEYLEQGIEKSGAKSGEILAIDPTTGEVLAMVNLPHSGWRNRIISDIFEPGSVFKIISIGSALDSGVVRPKDIFFCENGVYRFSQTTLHDHKKYSNLTVEEILRFSSNIGAAKVAQKLGKELFSDYIRRWGFASLTGIDLPGEVRGLLREPDDWSDICITRISMGQGIGVTHLQMALSMAVVANGGFLVKPYVVREIRDKSGRLIRRFSPERRHRVIKEKTSRVLRDILVSVVEEGTGCNAQIKGVKVAGKTGTAQKVSGGGGYSHRKFVASFFGFFPADNPKICLSVVLDEPWPVYYGGKVAAPIFKAVAEEIIHYLD